MSRRRTRHTGALAWIERFAQDVNGTGVPLVESLAKAGQHWYEMRADDLTELFASINYGDRLYFGRLTPRAFVNQRLIRLGLRPNAGVSAELCHALFNSTIGLFMLEGIGFGRGLGALDLNKDRLENVLHMLDPSRLSQSDVAKIEDAFSPIATREILNVADEMEQEDRRAFDTLLLSALSIEVKLDRIHESLLTLVSLRQTALT